MPLPPCCGDRKRTPANTELHAINIKPLTPCVLALSPSSIDLAAPHAPNLTPIGTSLSQVYHRSVLLDQGGRALVSSLTTSLSCSHLRPKAMRVSMARVARAGESRGPLALESKTHDRAPGAASARRAEWLGPHHKDSCPNNR